MLGPRGESLPRWGQKVLHLGQFFTPMIIKCLPCPTKWPSVIGDLQHNLTFPQLCREILAFLHIYVGFIAPLSHGQKKQKFDISLRRYINIVF